ncbi:hypothetical protein CERZMDRAFT_89569 [Cercospora zeae-maydis SCOH1-5]|uniref:Uncharacterized protein n=1 Tax=Cercospora zeae-maydis SCOH1-5 TaxID=717836 RepID=A0A6A6FWI0_9PEZI|nr:hypothetical protein CERZMDRAFT_89569 [Cercospora zeae-maydis SCOH1-5]
MSDTLCKLCVGSGVASASSMLPPYAPVRPPTVAPAQPHASSKFRAPSLAGPSTTQIEAKHEPLSQAMHDEVRTLCSTILWSAYCELPDPNDPDDYMRLNRVKSPPPSNWLAEAEKRVTIMFEAAGQEKISEYLRHEFSAWPRNNVNIMKALRDFAMWMRITGPFRRARRELGLLNEILGFDEKGRYWQSD